MNNQVMDDIKNARSTAWVNPLLESVQPGQEIAGLRPIEMKAAQNRLLRFMPYICRAFPETEAKKGLIESELVEIKSMEQWMKDEGVNTPGKLLLKMDSHLPIAGSVKARGGIYEVLKIAEELVVSQGLMKPNEDHSILVEQSFKDFFSNYTIQVGSTGNLGLSIGIMGATMGFRVIVHMSCDAKQWKKDLLREKGAIVKEYEGDYSSAVKQGRMESEKDLNSFFIDDENSKDLFMGYAAVGYRLKMQLFHAKCAVDEQHPLFVYLPCGVGGAPGGITYGLKQIYGDHVHCFFVEPTEAPCMLLGMVSGKHNDICVYDVGLSGKTAADGLAVGRASSLVGKAMEPLLSGAFTVEDEVLFKYMKAMYEKENIFLEPSACVGFEGYSRLMTSSSMQEYIKTQGLEPYMNQSTHIVWATGGGLVPESEIQCIG